MPTSENIARQPPNHAVADMTIVVPCYNEELALAETVRQLLALIDAQQQAGRCGSGSLLMLVDDGSTDRTWQLIERFSAAHAGRVAGLRLSRNVGHQHALLAGLTLAPGDVLISIDADLQDDIEVVPQMLDEYYGGHDIVYGVRDFRGTDTFFKRMTAAGFYRLMLRVGVDIIDNHADYRLMSRRAVDILGQFGEVNLFLRGMVRLIGLPSTRVAYERRRRIAGESKYSLFQMISLAVQGITSFSVAPLRVISVLGSIDLTLCPGGQRVGVHRGIHEPGGSAWLGFHCDTDHAHRRHSNPVDRCLGRIHRQGLPGDQAPTALCSGPQRRNESAGIR